MRRASWPAHRNVETVSLMTTCHLVVHTKATLRQLFPLHSLCLYRPARSCVCCQQSLSSIHVPFCQMHPRCCQMMCRLFSIRKVIPSSLKRIQLFCNKPGAATGQIPMQRPALYSRRALQAHDTVGGSTLNNPGRWAASRPERQEKSFYIPLEYRVYLLPYAIKFCHERVWFTVLSYRNLAETATETQIFSYPSLFI